MSSATDPGPEHAASAASGKPVSTVSLIARYIDQPNGCSDEDRLRLTEAVAADRGLLRGLRNQLVMDELLRWHHRGDDDAFVRHAVEMLGVKHSSDDIDLQMESVAIAEATDDSSDIDRRDGPPTADLVVGPDPAPSSDRRQAIPLTSSSPAEDEADEAAPTTPRREKAHTDLFASGGMLWWLAIAAFIGMTAWLLLKP